MIVPVILAGGSGSRLWPLSRSACPKQLLPLVSNRTLLQETILRVMDISDSVSPLVICNHEHRFLVAEQLLEIGITSPDVILEPESKNTAPAIALASLFLCKKYEDPILLILPADHVVQDNYEFILSIGVATHSAALNHLVTFGVKPTKPETGYGYIETVSDDTTCSIHKIKKFVEKPDKKTAQAYLEAGSYYWNSGMFMFKAKQFINELALHAPDILSVCEETINKATKDLDFIRLDKTSFANCRSDSIDYAVMEKTNNGMMVPLRSRWSDVGSWDALWNIAEADQGGNVLSGDVFLEGVENSYLRAESRLLAAVGVKDHIVIETADAVLVAHKDQCQNIKNIVTQLKNAKRSETDLHRKVYRPWGFYETVDAGKGFQVKRITVKPGAHLSLQMHHHRSEHWVIVSGTAEVTRGEDVFTIQCNQSTYIPVGVKHRLANPGKTNLEIIEVQSGHYLGEDDIVRFEDNYGRAECI